MVAHDDTVPDRIEREILIDAPVEVVWAFRWVVTGDSSTLVEFSLSAEGEATRLTVVESGFRDLAAPEEERREHFDDHTRGWGLELGELRDYVGRR